MPRTDDFFNHSHRGNVLERAYVAYCINPNHPLLNKLKGPDFAVIIRDAQLYGTLYFDDEKHAELTSWAWKKLEKINVFKEIIDIIDAMPDCGRPWHYLIDKACELSPDIESFLIAAGRAHESYDDSYAIQRNFKQKFQHFLQMAKGNKKKLLRLREYLQDKRLEKHFCSRYVGCDELSKSRNMIEEELLELISGDSRELFEAASGKKYGFLPSIKTKAIEMAKLLSP